MKSINVKFISYYNARKMKLREKKVILFKIIIFIFLLFKITLVHLSRGFTEDHYLDNSEERGLMRGSLKVERNG